MIYDLELLSRMSRVVVAGEAPPYERVGVYSPEEVHDWLWCETRVFEGREVRMNISRYKVFARSCECVGCGLKGEFYALERSMRRTHDGWQTTNSEWHFNLYGLTASGHPVLFTKDHIVPKSMDGPNTLDNLQTMCQPCNQKKKDRLPGESDVDYSRRRSQAAIAMREKNLLLHGRRMAAQARREGVPLGDLLRPHQRDALLKRGLYEKELVHA